jgi:hypothetical protein
MHVRMIGQELFDPLGLVGRKVIGDQMEHSSEVSTRPGALHSYSRVSGRTGAIQLQEANTVVRDFMVKLADIRSGSNSAGLVTGGSTFCLSELSRK